MERRLTQREARGALGAIGWVLRTVDGEHRVNAKGAPEAEAYYTTDLGDAVETAYFERGRQIGLIPATEG